MIFCRTRIPTLYRGGVLPVTRQDRTHLYGGEAQKANEIGYSIKVVTGEPAHKIMKFERAHCISVAVAEKVGFFDLSTFWMISGTLLYYTKHKPIGVGPSHCGVEEFGRNHTMESVIQEADRKLYLGKESGRNRVIY